MLESIRAFLRLEAACGILLLAAAVFGMIAANTASSSYESLLSLRLTVAAGDFAISKPLLLWVNDGLMAVFFFLIGLELKREVLEGELASPSQIVLPALAAAGGMLVPGLIYAAINWSDAHALRGWGIPTATDIAFALGVLTLLGSRVPHGLKVFLLTLAILDDLGAIVIIALFYTHELSATSLYVAAGALAVLGVLNWRGVNATTPYMLVGIVLWAAVLKSGVHATLAGVALAFFIPLDSADPEKPAPLRSLEHDLHPAVAFVILPLFAFANAGVPLAGLSASDLAAPVPLGIAAGLFVGKQVGVFVPSWIAIRLGLAKMPGGASTASLYGVAILCGIGFTMSLFIASLAFGGGQTDGTERLGIIAGSLISAIVGYAMLAITLRR